jgi:hypothetical protein
LWVHNGVLRRRRALSPYKNAPFSLPKPLRIFEDQ